MTQEEKNDNADDFRNRYLDDLKGFVDFFNDGEIAVQGDYKESWEFIKQDTNSLKRNTNISLLINSEIEGREIKSN